MRFGGLGEQMDVRRQTVFVARWLMDGSVPARGRREWAWARRSVAGIRLPVSPKPIERREFSSDTAAALSCPGPDGGAAGSGLSGLFRHPGLPMRRRANGGRASAAISGARARTLARSGRCKWAGLLVAVAGLLALPLQAQAQSKILVSNVGQTDATHGSLLDHDQAQAFTTGSNSAGYTLKSVEIDMQVLGESATVFTVSIHSDNSGTPGASLGTLRNPASLARDGVYAFTTRGIALAAATTYFVVIDSVGPFGGSLLLSINNTSSNAQDPGKASGWSIGDKSLYRNWNTSGAWTSFNDSKRIRVKGINPKVSNASISIADASAAENAGHFLFDVTLSRSFQNTVKVDFETISGGTATEGVDYHARRTYTHVILAGDRTAQMGFALIEDTVNDAGETVKVRLSNARVVDAYGNVKSVLDITRDEATGTIDAPPASTTNVSNLTIGIRDATGDEDDGWLDFRVRLSRKYTDLVCYDFETISGGSATEGTDYLKIPKATYWMQIGKRVDKPFVRLIDDSVNDNGETVKVKISNAHLCDDASQTVSITRAEATGTIRNTDPLPQAWLARFGRTAADHVVQAVEDRWQGEPRASHLTLGGRQTGDLFGWTGLAGPGDREKTENRDDPVASGTFWPQRSWLPSGSGMAVGGTAPGRTPNANDWNTAPGGLGADDREAGTTRSGGAGQGTLLGTFGVPDPRALTDIRALLLGSSFVYSKPLDEDGPARPAGWLGEWSAWGRTAVSRFSGADSGVSLDGEVVSAMLGFDSRWDRWLAGVVVSFSEGQGGYMHPELPGGSIRSSLTSFHPYARFELNERTSFWGVLGYGAGDLSLTPARSDTALGTKLENAMAAFGGRTALSVRTGEAGRFELAVRSDARLTNTVSESIEGLVGTAGQTGRARLMLEGSGSMRLASGAVLKPKLEAGLRYDTGDAETGAGLEVGGGLGYAAGRLSVEGNARGLLVHRDTEYEEWGFSGSIAYTPSKDGRGLSMRLGSAWGAPQSGVQSLWSQQDASGLVRNAAFEAAQRYQVELRYGLDGKTGRARWEPFVGVESGEGASRALRLGVKLTSGRHLDAGLELGQRQGRPGADPEQAVQLRGAFRW